MRHDAVMAPRRPESKAEFLARLRTSQLPVGVGSPHFSHGVVHEEGAFRVRRLVLRQEKVDAYRRAHSTFMPEHAEMLSEPIGEVVLEAPTLDELIKKIDGAPWPL